MLWASCAWLLTLLAVEWPMKKKPHILPANTTQHKCPFCGAPLLWIKEPRQYLAHIEPLCLDFEVADPHFIVARIQSQEDKEAKEKRAS